MTKQALLLPPEVFLIPTSANNGCRLVGVGRKADKWMRCQTAERKTRVKQDREYKFVTEDV